MSYIVICMISLIVGGICGFFASEPRRRRLDDDIHKHDKNDTKLQERGRVVVERERRLQESKKRHEEESAKFNATAVSFKELAAENQTLKRDLRNIVVSTRKIELDRDNQCDHQAVIDSRVNEIGRLYLKENVKWIGKALNSNNFGSSKKRILQVIEKCRRIGFEISTTDEEEFVGDLKEDYEKVVRAEYEREEQSRIKAQIREEQKLQSEIDRQIKDLEQQRLTIEAALKHAIEAATSAHSEEVERLKAELHDAEERSKRAVSQAQLTRSGYVYVTSNIGAFGEGVFKIGMSRRQDPLQRVKELSGASVPFPFDVHMMIASDDAPKLENMLHKELHNDRINKVNPRKEFFRTNVESIVKVVQHHHGEIEYVVDPEALQYRDGLEMTDDDLEFVGHVFAELDDEFEVSGEE